MGNTNNGVSVGNGALEMELPRSLENTKSNLDSRASIVSIGEH